MSRAVTLWGYIVLVIAGLAYQGLGLVVRRTPTIGRALIHFKRVPAARALLLSAWLWLGWHIFVRGSIE